MGQTHENWPLRAWEDSHFLHCSLTVSFLTSAKLQTKEDPTKFQGGELPLVAQWTHLLMAPGVLKGEGSKCLNKSGVRPKKEWATCRYYAQKN